MKIGLNQITLVMGIIMILFVLTGAVVITFTDVMSDRLHGTKRIAFIFVLIAYAIYRSFRVYQVYKSKKREE